MNQKKIKAEQINDMNPEKPKEDPLEDEVLGTPVESESVFGESFMNPPKKDPENKS